VVCVANQKGGVGKTTTAVSVSAALAGRGVEVLLVDLDPQCNATTGLGHRGEEGRPSTYGVLIEELPPEKAIVSTDVPGLSLLPSSLDLAGAEIELVPLFTRERRLADALADVRDRYDLVILDCPPTLGLITVNALVAADEVLLPIQCEYYALEGVSQLTRTIDLVRRSLNPDLAVGGVVLTMFDGRTRLSEQVATEVRRHFADRVFRTVIPRSVRLSEAPGFGQPVTLFDPASRGARAYERLASEIAERLGLDVTGGSILDDLARREGAP
jgi:chromosome partitioning protein